MVIDSTKNYLSEVFDFLPSHVLLDKGMTGCGGTTLELTCKRNSLVLVPTVNLVLNKTLDGMLGVTAKTKDSEITEYINSDIPYKKIIGTYDSLMKLINIPSIKDYFLLIDEYHYLFTYYKFRNNAIKFLLQNYTQFKDWCFMTATPLSDYNILEELKGIQTLKLEWRGKAQLQIKFSPTEFYNKLLDQRIYECLNSNYNLHIFLNCFATIKKIVNDYDKLPYRVVCSPNQKDKSALNFQSVNSPVKKINFYTATAFEGVDIFDPVGKTIIVSDSKIVSTMMDISINIPQIAGRLRNSQWLNEIEYIYSATKHRYLNKNDLQWEQFVNSNRVDGNNILSGFAKLDQVEKSTFIRKFDELELFGAYINHTTDDVYHDPNLLRCDQDNYKIFKNLSSLYTHSPKVQAELVQKVNSFKTEIEEIAYSFLIKGHEYTKPELEELFFTKQLIPKQKIYDHFISENFDNFESKRKTIKGKKYTVYKFY